MMNYTICEMDSFSVIGQEIELSNKAKAIIELEKLKNDVVNFFVNQGINMQNYKQSYVSQL